MPRWYSARTVCRERDSNTDGTLDDRYYYLQNWRHDVVAIMNYDGAMKERVMYDAYGRPHSFSPGDLKGGGGSSNDRPDGVLNSTDTWATGSVAWNRDLGNSSGAAIPDGVVDANDGTTLTNLKAAGYSGGWGLLSSSAIGNRKGYAGYEFDTVLNGAAGVDEKPVYHVRHRVLASDTGKWLQKDPLGYHDGMDLYEYCQSDSMDNLDAMGLACGPSCSIRVSVGASRAAVRVTMVPPIPHLEPDTRPRPPWPPDLNCEDECDMLCGTLPPDSLARAVCTETCLATCIAFPRSECVRRRDLRFDPRYFPQLNAVCKFGCNIGEPAGWVPGNWLDPYEASQETICLLACEAKSHAAVAKCNEDHIASVLAWSFWCSPIRNGVTQESCDRARRQLDRIYDDCVLDAMLQQFKCKSKCNPVIL